jgi:hypothetical protein
MAFLTKIAPLQFIYSPPTALWTGVALHNPYEYGRYPAILIAGWNMSVFTVEALILGTIALIGFILMLRNKKAAYVLLGLFLGIVVLQIMQVPRYNLTLGGLVWPAVLAASYLYLVVSFINGRRKLGVVAEVPSGH